MGERLRLEYANGTRGSGEVVAASEDGITIAVDAEHWRLTPWQPGDAVIAIQTTGMYSTYWVVRSRGA
jgi:hypothetical protein